MIASIDKSHKRWKIMSLQSIAHNAGRLWFLKKHKNQISVNIPAQLLNVRHVLVLMPENEAEYRSTAKELPMLNTLFPKADFVFVKLKSLPPIYTPTGSVAIEWEAADMDYWGLPNRQIKKHIFSRPFDLALDLSLSIGFFNLAIAHHSLASLKICFSHPQREDVFNFIISFPIQPSMERAFNALRRCIAGK
jgi:hypothetical protein